MYCTREDIEQVFGRGNVIIWANLDNIELDSESEAIIDQRIDAMIEKASYFIDSFVEDKYVTPLEPLYSTEIDPLIRSLCATLAGVYLYEARGVEDYDDEGKPHHRLSYHRSDVYRMLNNIAFGSKKINYLKRYKRGPSCG